MKICGIIAEYNPFHNGHEYHIKRALEVSGADACVVVMSGNFVQRGAPACMDKWARAEMAVLSGADLVIELPVYFSNASAEDFAYGAITLLEKLGCDYVCFGSELGDIDKILPIARAIANPSDEYNERFKASLSEGLSYHDAMISSLKLHFGDDFKLGSNDLLSISYLKAIISNNYKIVPMCIERKHNNYNDDTVNDMNFSSATAIRAVLERRSINFDIVKDAVPADVFDIIYNYPRFCSIEDLHSIFNAVFIREYPSRIMNIRGVSEGIENKIFENLSIKYPLRELIDTVSGKRYSRSRISRLIIDIILGIEKMSSEDMYANLDYARVLAMKRDTSALRELKLRSELRFFTNLGKDLKKYRKNNPLIDMDINATRTYSLINYAIDISHDFKKIPSRL